MCFNFNCICFNNSSTSKAKMPEKLVHFNDTFMLKLTFMIATICWLDLYLFVQSGSILCLTSAFEVIHIRNISVIKVCLLLSRRRWFSNFLTKKTNYMSITDIVQSVCISINSRAPFTLHVYTTFVDVTKSKRVSPLQMANCCVLCSNTTHTFPVVVKIADLLFLYDFS
jgi:hypothetical protein